MHNRENRKGHLTVCPSGYNTSCILRIRTVRILLDNCGHRAACPYLLLRSRCACQSLWATIRCTQVLESRQQNPTSNMAMQVRFITKKYYDKNKDLDYRDMSSEAIEASSDNGGLNVMSKWYQNADYKALLTGTFEKETGTEYKIDSEKAKKLKEKIETDGIGNSKRDNALTDIYNSLK